MDVNTSAVNMDETVTQQPVTLPELPRPDVKSRSKSLDTDVSIHRAAEHKTSHTDQLSSQNQIRRNSYEGVSKMQRVMNNEKAVKALTEEHAHNYMKEKSSSPNPTAHTVENFGIWHTSDQLETIQESALPDLVIGFDGFRTDPESKHK